MLKVENFSKVVCVNSIEKKLTITNIIFKFWIQNKDHWRIVIFIWFLRKFHIFWLTFKLIWNADRLNFYSCVKKFNYKNKIYRNSKNWQLEKIIDLTIFWNWISPSRTALKAPFSQMAIFFLAKNNVNISLKVHQINEWIFFFFEKLH